jgi:hypothetical protein
VSVVFTLSSLSVSSFFGTSVLQIAMASTKPSLNVLLAPVKTSLFVGVGAEAVLTIDAQLRQS